MSDSKKILESWLMFEHLVDGSISNKDKKLLKFDQKEINDEFNFYHFFQEKLKIIKDKNKGIIFYFGIFDFDKLLNKLQKPYVLDPLDENEEVDDKKFSFALCFDGDLKCCYEQSFFCLMDIFIIKMKMIFILILIINFKNLKLIKKIS
nr:hypothetical protein [Ureaplasma urealyticum]